MGFIVSTRRIGSYQTNYYHDYSNTAYTQARRHWERMSEDDRKLHATVQIWTTFIGQQGSVLPRDLIWENGKGLE